MSDKRILHDTKLEPVCKRCFYRRGMNGKNYYSGDSKAQSTCDYLLITGELRGCEPKGKICEKFRPREAGSKKKVKMIV